MEGSDINQVLLYRWMLWLHVRLGNRGIVVLMLCDKDVGIPVLWMWLNRCCIVELVVRIFVVVVILVFVVTSCPLRWFEYE